MKTKVSIERNPIGGTHTITVSCRVCGKVYENYFYYEENIDPRVERRRVAARVRYHMKTHPEDYCKC